MSSPVGFLNMKFLQRTFQNQALSCKKGLVQICRAPVAFISIISHVKTTNGSLTEIQTDIDTGRPLNVFKHCRRLPPRKIIDAVIVRQVAGRMCFGRIALIADVAGLGDAGSANLQAVLLWPSPATRICCLYRPPESVSN